MEVYESKVDKIWYSVNYTADTMSNIVNVDIVSNFIFECFFSIAL